MFQRGAASAIANEQALLPALLDVEAALARACATVGLIPAAAAVAIDEVCRDRDRFDVEALAAETAHHAQPVVAVVAAIRESVGAEAAPFVHHGATSQDILDSALMLLARRATRPMLDDIGIAIAAAADLAVAHADTPIIGRTLLKQAVPTTFGLKAAGWALSLEGAAAALERVRDEVLAIQLGGPVGALNAPELVDAFADELELRVPLLPWHADRRRIAELAGALGVAAGASAKIAGDVALLSQDEIGELREGGPGGESSSMPHKRNPVASVSVLACAHRTPAMVATLLGGMAQEQERGAGRWQAEWPTLLELLTATGSALAWLADLCSNLEVDARRMMANVGDAEQPTGAAALVARALEGLRPPPRS